MAGLVLEGITKDFPGVRALDDVTFDVQPGEIHALVGENGAGKSTLMKVLGGVYMPSAGTLTLAGPPSAIAPSTIALPKAPPSPLTGPSVTPVAWDRKRSGRRL